MFNSPWKSEKYDGASSFLDIVDSKRQVLANVDSGLPKNSAIANLIALAPELFEALKKAEPQLIGKVRDDVRALISKVENG